MLSVIQTKNIKPVINSSNSLRYGLVKTCGLCRKLYINSFILSGVIGVNSSITFIKAQKGPLNGSGKIISKTFDNKDFDKIELKDFDGKVEIEVGKPFSISIDIDDNLEKLLSVKENNGKLKIEFEGNENNKKVHLWFWYLKPKGTVTINCSRVKTTTTMQMQYNVCILVCHLP